MKVRRSACEKRVSVNNDVQVEMASYTWRAEYLIVILLCFWCCCCKVVAFIFHLFFVFCSIHSSHPSKRAFYAKWELITRIYYDVVRFVHICSSAHFALVSLGVLASRVKHKAHQTATLCHPLTRAPRVFDYSPYFLYQKRSIIVFFFFLLFGKVPAIRMGCHVFARKSV